MAQTKLIKHKSGLKIFYKKMKINEAVLIKFNFKAGSFNNLSKPGLAHFVEHSVSFGSKSWPREQFAKFKDSLVNRNFSTSAQYMFFWAYCSVKDAEKVFESYSNVLGNIDFNEEFFKNEKAIIIQETTYRRTEIGVDLFTALINTLLKDSQVKNGMKLLGMGEPEDIEKLSIDNLKKFVDDYFKLENMDIICSGNISKSKLMSWVNKYVIANLKSGLNVEPVVFPKQIWPKPSLKIYASSENEKSAVRLLYKVNGLDAKNIFSRKIVVLLNEDVNTISKNIFRTKHGLCYSCFSKILSFYDQYYFYIDVICNQRQVNDVLKRVPEVVNEIKNYRLTQERKLEIMEILEKVDDAAAPHPRNYEFVDEYFDRHGSLSSKKMQKKYKKDLKAMPVDDINNILIDIFKENPIVFIVSNADKSKFPTYSQFLKSLNNEKAIIKKNKNVAGKPINKKTIK